MRLILPILGFSLLLSAGDGVPPRPGPTDYPVRQPAAAATLAAVRVPARQVEKMFSPEIARQYVVLEVAVYPRDGASFDVDWFDFNLKIGGTIVHVEKPRDVVTPWPEKSRLPSNMPAVVTETGVVIGHTSDPVNGGRTEVGTWQGVGVTNDPRAGAPPAPPKQGPDPQIVEQRVRERSLPEGIARKAVAGYLFFPLYKAKHRNSLLELDWSRDNDSAALRLPEK